MKLTWLPSWVVAVVAVAASSAGGGVAEATFAGGNGLVAYVDASCDEDFREPGSCPDAVVKVADLRRPGKRRTVAGTGSCLPDAPAWSSNGKLLLYGCGKQVFMSRRDGSPDKLVVEDATEVAWSATGQRLVFSRGVSSSRGRPARLELFVRAVGGGHARRITRVGGMRADWSSRGEIAFSKYVRGFRTDVFSVRPEGTGLRRLTRGGSSDHPSWSPDGRLLAIERQSGFTKVNIVLIDRRGRVRRTLTRKGGSRPVWSPDGSRIAFSRGSRLYTVRARGGGLRRILRGVDASNGQLAWQPRPRHR